MESSRNCGNVNLMVWFLDLKKFMERVKGVEPLTSTLARLHSTTELHPHRISKTKNIICNLQKSKR